MSEQITFIHAADLHIGAPLKGLRALSSTWAERLIGAIPESFDRVVETALEDQVDFVLIAGDVFDSSTASYADYRRFFAGLKKLVEASIPVYICAGNHDPLSSWKREFFALPEGVYLFPSDAPSFQLFEREGQALAAIGGRSFAHRSWPDNESIARGITRDAAQEALSCAPLFYLGMVHTGLDIDRGYAPLDPAELMRSGMDYWALGHIHQQQVISAANPCIAYAGCVQGRDIGETGARGILEVRLAEGENPQIKSVPTASVCWQRLSVDVSDCGHVADVSERIMREIAHESSRLQCEELCVRVELRGETSLHRVLATPGVLEEIRTEINNTYAYFFCDALLDRTRAPLDREALQKEGLFPAVLMQVASAQRQSPEASIAYLEDAFLEKKLRLPTEVVCDQAKLHDDAESLVLDLLGRDEAR